MNNEPEIMPDDTPRPSTDHRTRRMRPADALDETQGETISGTRGMAPLPPLEQQPDPWATGQRPASAQLPPARPQTAQPRGPGVVYRPANVDPRLARGGLPSAVPPVRPARRRSPFYIPLWSIALMLITVAGLAAGIVLLILALGGREGDGGEPRIVVISPERSLRPAIFPISPATSTLPPQIEPLVQQPPRMELAGPTLAPIPITPTPRALAVGERVIVANVGDQELNVRDQPGVFGTTILFRIPQGSTLRIIGGPEDMDGLVWWQVQDPINTARTGWAAADYLLVAPE
jgi:hypothetical protein